MTPDLRGQTLAAVERDFTVRLSTAEGWHIATGNEALPPTNTSGDS